MDTLRIFKRLKNGKSIETFYRKSNDITYTIRLDNKNNLFTLHFYYLDGNDVFDETNYKDERMETFSDFDELVKTIQLKFPGIEIKL